MNEIELRTIKEKYTLKPEPPESFDFIRKSAIEKKISEFNKNFRNGLVKIKKLWFKILLSRYTFSAEFKVDPIIIYANIFF